MLNVQVEMISENHWLAGELVVKGQKIAVSPVTAQKLIDRGHAVKCGVVEAEAEQEDEAVEPDDLEEVAEDPDDDEL